MAKKKSKKINKKLRTTLVSLALLLLVAGISYGSYYVLNNLNKGPNGDDGNGEPGSSDNVNFSNPNESALVFYNDSFSLTKDSVFYQTTKSEIVTYYKNVKFSGTNEELQTSLFELLKTNQKKVTYEGNNSSLGMNKSWANYTLVDRNFNSSPLTKEEVEANKWNMNVNLDALYLIEDYKFSGSGDGTFINREHIFAKSYGFNGANDKYKKLLAGCDLHNLRSGEANGNQDGHNNRLFNNLNKNASDTKTCVDSVTGTNSTYYNDQYFEPLDNEKGDIARSIFYMVARYNKYYEDENGESPWLSITNEATRLSGTLDPIDTKDKPAEYGILSTLLTWDKLDPVDDFETGRNNLVYNIQGNRNPFVDFSNLASVYFK